MVMKELFLFYQTYIDPVFEMENFAFLPYLLTFLLLLRVRSLKFSKSWFIPLFAMYFGFSFGTLFALFLNGADSRFLPSDTFFSVISNVFNPIKANNKGKVMYGGYLGSIFGIWFANFIFRRKSLSEYLDITAIASSLFFAIWRIGCFFSGCCFGFPSKTFGVSFLMGSKAFNLLQGTDLIVGNETVPLLPTQLMSSAYGFAIFLFLLILFCKNKTRYPYFYFFAQAFFYGIGRFTVEFLRIDPREFWGPLSMSQWISLGLVAASLVFFIKNRKEIVQSFRRDVS